MAGLIHSRHTPFLSVSDDPTGMLGVWRDSWRTSVIPKLETRNGKVGEDTMLTRWISLEFLGKFEFVSKGKND